MVWTDNQQRLHLRIAKKESHWHCSELICNASQGYKRYEFDVGSRLDLLDPNIIAGIFTWDECSPYVQPPNSYFREIDFEFSKWGNAGNENSQFVVQPWDITGNIDRFNINLAGLSHSVHCFDWTSDSIVFKSTWGGSSYSWNYTNQAYIPTPGNENIRINFWLLNGAFPSDNRPAELILNSFLTDTEDHDIVFADVNVFPNPFEYGCTIDIQSSGVTDTEITITDMHGNHIHKVFSGNLFMGLHRFEWDGKNQQGQLIRPGLYILQIRNIQKTGYYKIIKT